MGLVNQCAVVVQRFIFYTEKSCRVSSCLGVMSIYVSRSYEYCIDVDIYVSLFVGCASVCRNL
jgi:hypothetical protein